MKFKDYSSYIVGVLAGVFSAIMLVYLPLSWASSSSSSDREWHWKDECPKCEDRHQHHPSDPCDSCPGEMCFDTSDISITPFTEGELSLCGLRWLNNQGKRLNFDIDVLRTLKDKGVTIKKAKVNRKKGRVVFKIVIDLPGGR